MSLFENHSGLPLLHDFDLANEGDLVMFFDGEQIVGWMSLDHYALLWESVQ